MVSSRSLHGWRMHTTSSRTGPMRTRRPGLVGDSTVVEGQVASGETRRDRRAVRRGGLGQRLRALHGDLAVPGAVVAVAHDPAPGLHLHGVERSHRQPGRLRDVDAGERGHLPSLVSGLPHRRWCASPRRRLGEDARLVRRLREQPVGLLSAGPLSFSFGPVWWRRTTRSARRPAIGWSKTASCRLTGSAPAAPRRTHPSDRKQYDACLRPHTPTTPSTPSLSTTA